MHHASLIAELKKKQNVNDPNADGKGGSIRKELPPTVIAPSILKPDEPKEKKVQSNWTAPDGFICPLTKQFMRDPVMAADNYSYEKEAIEHFLKSSDISPITGEKLPNTELIPNINLRQAIEKFKEMSEGKVRANWEKLDGLRCSISNDGFMREPHITSNGYSYEKNAIQKRLLPPQKCICPKTSSPLSTSATRPNHNLQQVIQFFIRKTLEQIQPGSGKTLDQKVFFESAAMQHKWASDYSNGQAVTQDLKAAVFWFRKAAQQGYKDALYDLGRCYTKGLGVELNDKEAVHWFSQAAKLDHAVAQHFLGIHFLEGRGVTKDCKQGVYWMSRSANQGSQESSKAAYNLGVFYAHGKYEIKKDLTQAELWYCKAADDGSVDAQFVLGVSYEYSLLGKKNYEQAVRWYGEAARRGHPDAQFHLDLCFILGRGKSQFDKMMPEYKPTTSWSSETQLLWAKRYFTDDPKDPEKAKHLFLQAANQGHREAQYHIAECCMNGTGGMAKDEKAAVKWYRLAADQKHPQAQLRLGQCYARAQGVEMNLQQALSWYQQAEAEGNSEAAQIIKKITTVMSEVPQNLSQNHFTLLSEKDQKSGGPQQTPKSTTSSTSTTSFGTR